MNFEKTSDVARQRDIFEVTCSSLTGDCWVSSVRRVKRVVGEWECVRRTGTWVRPRVMLSLARLLAVSRP